MAIPLTGAGSLFVKLGHIGGIFNDINLVRGSAIAAPDYSTTIKSKVDTLVADYAAGTAEKNIIDGFYAQLAAWQNAQAGMLTQCQQLAQSTLIDMANNDTPLAQKTVAAAMALLVAQMTANSNSVNASSVSIGAQTNGTPAPNGNPIIVMSTKAGTGLAVEYALPETLTFTITGDSQAGTGTLNQEPMSIKGQAVVGNALDYLWPGGSGTSKQINLIDASQNNSAGTLLQNGEFATATTTNYPDNWTILVGAAGTTVFQAGSGYYDSNSLQFTGDVGGSLISVAQAFNTTPSTTAGSGGTSAKVLPDVPYAVNAWIKCSATPAAGVLAFDLVDGTNTVINDDQGTANTFTKALTAVSTSWVNVNGVFRLPKLLPSTVKLRIRLSTAIDNGKSVYIDRVAMSGVSNSSGMTQLYPGGPFAAAFSGNTKVLTNDYWTMAVSNTFGGFQRLFERWFGMKGLGLQLPSSGSPTINDNLIA